MFMQESKQEEAFGAIKNMIRATPLLKHYGVASETTIQSDATESALEATLLRMDTPCHFHHDY